ncbi:MAG: 7-cyano-7-deazaguanine synthase, partial [archaeon]|nr:7-cyano-7-deazaguanine synthase [archaeon]
MKIIKTRAKKVMVAMSGGVDSSVAAALLKKAGFKISGVFLKLVDLPRFRESEKRARKIAKTLKIPFLVLDL